ncbi:MAG: hydroxypyruvate isomerase family protein [Phycisphaeraceae bacterium]
MPIKQSVMYPMFRAADTAPERVLARLAEIGYAAVEFTFRNDETDQLIAATREHGLAVASFVGHRTLGDGLNKRSNHARIEQELRANIDFAAEHGIPGLICFSGNRNPHQSEADAIDATAEGFQRVAGYAEQKGVTLNMELLNSKVNHAGYQCDHTVWGAAVCERVNSPSVKLLYDVYHMQIMEGDVIRTMREHMHWIGHIHTAGNPGRQDLDDTQELNYRGICKAIAESDYEGYVGHEFSPKGDPLAAAETAFAICDQ